MNVAPPRDTRGARRQSIAPAAPPRDAERKFFEPAQIVARVGDQSIFYGELLAAVNQFLAPQKDKLSKWEIEKAREQLIKQMLEVTIDNKLRYLDFLRSFPQPDQLPEIYKRVDEQFYEKQLPELIERAKVENAADLDLMLRKYGSSLEMSRIRFREQVLAQQVLQQKIDTDPEITHADMLDYYRQHAEDYAFPAKARWEQLMVRFDKFPSERDAEIALGKMGNRVYLGGAPLYAVAKEDSQGYNADEGGYNDWTNQGSHASEEIDRALFSLEVGRLSRIVKSKVGLHIIRVIERREGGRVPFTEAQVEIKEKLREEIIKKAQAEYIAGLRKEIDVWTIFDDEKSTASSANEGTSSGAFRTE